MKAVQQEHMNLKILCASKKEKEKINYSQINYRVFSSKNKNSCITF
jgi:hypothetical protein